MAVRGKNAGYRIHSFLVSSFGSAVVSRTRGTDYSTLTLPSPSIGKVNRLIQSNLHFEKQYNRYWDNGFFLEQEEEENAGHIKRVISSVHSSAVEDVVQALKCDECCGRIQLTSNLVDALLHKFGDDWKSAMGFFQWANLHSGYEHPSLSCDKMVDLLGKVKQLDRMWALVNELHGRGLITLGTIARIMRRLTGAGRYNDAIKLFNDLNSFGLDRNTESMNVLLDTLCKEKKVDLAREVFLGLKADIHPDEFTFNIFVNGWCCARRIDEAMWTIQEMKNYGFHPSVITYSTIIQAHCQRSDFTKVYDLLDKMAVDGCHPNVVTYTMIMRSLARSHKIEEALGVVTKMKLSGCKPDTLFYNTLIDILGKAGKVSEASHIFGVEMKTNGVSPNLSTYNTMISIFCNHNQKENALGVLEEMEKSSCRPVLQTYYPLLKLCLKTKELDDQFNMLLTDIADKHHLSLDLDTYTLLIHGYLNAQKIEWAFKLYDEMISRDILPKVRTLQLLMSEAERNDIDGRVEKIRLLMKQFGEKTPNKV